jgi:hypothetical protein
MGEGLPARELCALLALGLAVDTIRLERKRRTGIVGSWDGREQPVTHWDGIVSGGLCAAMLIGCLMLWLG